MRLFFALGFEEESNQDAVARIVTLKDQLSGNGRAVQNDNLHLTLAFLGEVHEADLPRVLGKGNTVNVPAFSLTTGEVRHWRKSKVQWLSIQEPPSALLSLATQLAPPAANDKALHYIPHITLRRHVANAETIPSQPIHLNCRQFGLYQSVQVQQNGKTTVQYRCLKHWPLT